MILKGDLNIIMMIIKNYGKFTFLKYLYKYIRFSEMLIARIVIYGLVYLLESSNQVTK